MTGIAEADHLALAADRCRPAQCPQHLGRLCQLLFQLSAVAPQQLDALAVLPAFQGEALQAQHVSFQLLLVLQGMLYQRHQCIIGPLFGFQAQALMQADHFLHQGGEEAPGKGALFGEQGFELQAELVGLALEVLEFLLVRQQAKRRDVHCL